MIFFCAGRKWKEKKREKIQFCIKQEEKTKKKIINKIPTQHKKI